MTENIRARSKRLADYFNLTIEKWDAMDEYQRSLCVLCGRPEPRPRRRLAVDHSHVDGLVRGLLCSQCNPLLGKLENAFIRLGLHKVPGLTLPMIAEKIAAYLKNPPAISALGQAVYGYAGRTGTKTHRKHIKRLRKGVTPTKPLSQTRKGHK